MAVTTRFVPDRTFPQDFLRSAGVRAIVDDRTEAAAVRARQLASSQRVKEAIETEVVLESDGYVGRVIANHWISGFDEFGTSERAARPFLRPAVEAEVGPLRDRDA